MPAQYRSIELLRAMACLMVVIYHAQEAWAPHGAPNPWPNGAAGVDLFFVISGFVMAQSCERLASRPNGWRIFAWRRAARIIPLYWGLTSLKLAITLAHPALTPATAPGAWNIAASYLFIPARDGLGVVRPVLGVGWTLQYEMLFYAVFAWGLGRQNPSLRFLAAVLGPLALLGFCTQPGWPAPFVLANGMVLEFCAGVALARFRTSLSRGASICLLLAGAGLLLNVPSHGVWRCFCWGIPAASLLVGAVSMERALPDSRLARAMITVGGASYSIYLLHPFIVPALSHLLKPWVGIPAAILLSLVGGVGLHVGVDAPLQGLLRKQEFSFLKKRSRKLLSV